MGRRLGWVVTGSLVLVGMFVLAGAPAERAARYVGVKGCRSCHKTLRIGDQFAKWSGSAHARAYETLTTPKADSLAATVGVDEPASDGRCLRCHTAAWGVPPETLTKDYRVEEGVQCEACHGPGSEYRGLKTMMDREKAVEKGLWILGEKGCRRCHAAPDSVSLLRVPAFHFEQAMKKIEHAVPPDTTDGNG